MTTSQNPISVTPERHDETILMFSMDLASGGLADGSVSFNVDTTIGLGGMGVRMTVKQEGKPDTVETIDLADLVQAWVNQIVSTT